MLIYLTKMQKNIVAAMLCVALTSACTTEKYATATTEKVQATQVQVDDGRSQILERKASIPVYQRVPGLWISDRVVSQTSSQRLPTEFEEQFVLREQAALTLADIADAIRASTGFSIALQGEPIGLADQRFAIDHIGSLRSLLDSVASRTGVSWSWEGKTIVILQSVAQTFPVHRAGIDPVKAVTLTGAANTSSNSAGSATPPPDPYAELVAAIRVISPKSRVSVLRNASAIMVSDTPASMKRIAQLIEFDDRQSSKQVTLLWRLVNFTTSNSAEAAIDLQYLLSRSGGALSLASTATLASVNAGALTLTSPAPDAGTSAIKLLNEIGNVFVAKSGVATIRNNGRDDISNEKEIFYISKTSSGPAAPTGTTGPAAVGIDQSSVKVGLSGAFGVTIYENESMDLSFDFSVAFLDQLVSTTSAGQLIQSPNVSKRSGRGALSVRHGETFILTSQSSDGATYDRRGMLPDTIIAGSDRGSRTSEQWLLIVTPIITKKGVKQ